MKTSSLVKKYFEKRIKNLLLLVEKPESTFSENDFHSVRVEIKKIKGLFSLLENIYPHFDRKREYSPFKIIFSHAGMVRELQVQLHMISSYPPKDATEKFKHILLQQIGQEKKKFLSLLKPSLIKKIKEKKSKVWKFLDQVDHKGTLHFLHKEEISIKKFLDNDPLHPSGLHQLRKRLKKIFFIQRMIRSEKKELVLTDHFQELLGQWHDGRILETGLRNFIRSGIILPKDILAIENLKSKISKKDQRLFQKILLKKEELFLPHVASSTVEKS